MFIGNRQRGFLLSRLPIPRPGPGAYTFACPRCDMILADGPAYAQCPACDVAVDWVDLRKPVWACPNCDAMRNGDLDDALRCEVCSCQLVQIHDPDSTYRDRLEELPGGFMQKCMDAVSGPVGIALLLGLGLFPLLSLAADPRWRLLALALIAPLLLTPVIMGGIVVGSFMAGWRELRALVRDRKVRTIHGLEHATAHVLEQKGATVLGGYTGPTYFRLQIAYAGLSCDAVHAAFDEAVQRVLGGERRLASHRRCGTSYMGVLLVASVLALLAAPLAYLAQVDFVVLSSLAAVYVIALALAGRKLGLLLQRNFTVSTDFKNAQAARVLLRVDEDHGAWYDVHVCLDGERLQPLPSGSKVA